MPSSVSRARVNDKPLDFSASKLIYGDPLIQFNWINYLVGSVATLGDVGREKNCLLSMRLGGSPQFGWISDSTGPKKDPNLAISVIDGPFSLRPSLTWPSGYSIIVSFEARRRRRLLRRCWGVKNYLELLVPLCWSDQQAHEKLI